MALQSIGKLLIGDQAAPMALGAIDGTGALQMNSTNTKLAFFVSVPTMAANSITSVGLKVSAVSASPAPPTLTVGLYPVNADGTPNTAAPYGGSAPGTIAAPAVGWYDVTLPTPATATPGDLVAIVVSGTFTTTMTANFGGWSTGYYDETVCWSLWTGAAWAKQIRTFPTAIALGYSGVYPDIGSYPATGLMAYSSFNASANPNEYGLQFTPNVKLTVTGLWTIAANADSTYCLRQGTTLLTSRTIYAAQTMGQGQRRQYDFPTPQTLTAGTTYTLSNLAAGVASTRLSYYPVPPSIDCWGPFGIPSAWSPAMVSRNGAAWSTIANQVPVIGPVISQFDDGKGGGGAAGSRIFGGF